MTLPFDIEHENYFTKTRNVECAGINNYRRNIFKFYSNYEGKKRLQVRSIIISRKISNQIVILALGKCGFLRFLLFSGVLNPY